MQLTRGRLAVGAVCVAAVVIALLLWRRQGGEDKQPAALPATTGGAPVASAPAASVAVRPAPPAASSLRADDPIGHAADLRAIDERLRKSANPAERRVARRAFSSCIPAFLPPAGQAVSPEAMIRALPAAQRSEREAAWRDIFARCQRFASDGREALIQEHADWRGDTESADPGARAVTAARSGRLDEAALLVAAISTSDPASIDQLSGIARQLARQREADDRDLALRASAVDTALPLVACDLGLACDATSLRALQLCAAQAACEGDVASRVLARAGADQALAEAAQRERARLVAILRANGKLALGDLLP